MPALRLYPDKYYIDRNLGLEAGVHSRGVLVNIKIPFKFERHYDWIMVFDLVFMEVQLENTAKSHIWTSSPPEH